MPGTGISRRVGLARVLSKFGYCSRSRAFELVKEGRVSVNGAVRRDPEAPIHIGKDQVAVDGQPLAAEARLYLMLNKPRGTITTASDEKGRPTVYRHLEGNLPWVGPVGRLDKASEGLLLLTNDSEWADAVLSPDTHLEKTYHVQVAIQAEDSLLRKLLQGIRSGDDTLRAKTARILRGGQKNTWLEIVLEEGKNRHIRRMFAGLEVEVLRLVRVAIGPLHLGLLPKGSLRRLTDVEKQAIDRAMRAKSVKAFGNT